MKKVFLLLGVLSGCSQSNPGATSDALVDHPSAPVMNVTPLPQQRSSTPLPEGISINVTTPDGVGRRKLPSSRQVASITQPLQEFKRTVEGTYLKLNLVLPASFLEKGDTAVKLMSDGELVQSALEQSTGTEPLKVQLDGFRTPYLDRDQRKIGFANINYELLITSGAKQNRVPFSIAVFDEAQPTYVVPREGECLIYMPPERASGCYQNRTRSTQEVVFNDNITQTHELSVEYSGGISIPISIVGFSFGGSKSTTDGVQVSRGSEIHFTNCILCSSVIYRQEVKTVRKGDIYQVMADGSVMFAGETTVTSSQVAYEFTSTGSESRDYDCDIKSQLPVGYGAGCKQ